MKKYAAKILLFGEYTIIKDGSALAFPLYQYSGSWQFSKSISNDNLVTWAKHIEINQQLKSTDFQINTDQFLKDLKEGLYFQSDIPIGYGVGSSGALCAALYEAYTPPETRVLPKNDTIFTLKQIFQTLENFFHGSSSGVDPLIPYFNQPLLLKGKTEATLIELKQPLQNDGAVFLLDTQRPRQTEPLVHYFLEKLKFDIFKISFEKEWCVYNETVIQSFLNQDYPQLFEYLRLLSAFQLRHLPPMIPSDCVKIWEEGLQNNVYTLKLCGAGGGGFLLGFTKDWEQTKAVLNQKAIFKIMDF